MPMKTDNNHHQLMHSVLQRVATGPELSKSISFDEARDTMAAVLNEEVDPVQAGVFLIALRMKRETDDELRGVLQAVLDVTEHAVAPTDEVVDLVDPYDGFNRNLLVSPFVPAVLAACGVPAFSHGVVSVGPKHGATHSQVLQAAGCNVSRSPHAVAERLGDADIGWGYVDQSAFSPKLHGLLRLRELIVKRPALTTVETLAQPLTGQRKTHLMTGYVHKPYPRIYAMLARHAQFDSALLVRGIEGGVTPSLRQNARFWACHGSAPETDTDITPAAIGIEQPTRGVPLPDGLDGYRRKTDLTGDAVDAAAIARASAKAGMAALNGTTGAARDSLVYAASLCLLHTAKAATLPDAASVVRTVLDSGRALAHFQHGR